MKLYSQRDPKWANIKLGFGNTTIGSHGCKLTSFSIITEIPPDVLNEKFKKDGCFLRDLLIDEKIALSLDISPNDTTSTNPNKICVAEVDMSPSAGKQQHFVVWNDNNSITDPWTGTIRPATTYPIINYRTFNFDKYLNDNTMELSKDQKKDLSKLGFDFGDNLNSGELDRLIKKALDTPQNCDAQNKEIADLKVRIADLEPKADIGNRFSEVVKMV